MTSREERLRLTNLADLLAQDLSTLDDETLVAGLRDAELTAAKATEWSAQIVAVLKSRHSWAKLVEITGLPQTTLHNRVHPRRRRRAEGE